MIRTKVEPRVRLQYKPPVNKHPCNKESLSNQFRIMNMTPADIVREVLLNSPDRSPDPSDRISAQNSNMRQQAISLVEQLQEKYNRLLIKYSKANNTIDHLRLKVNLYSDPPKPHSVTQSRLSHDSSKVTTLDFPQAQRAEINSGSLHPDGHCPPPSPDVGEQMARILYTQTDSFLQHLRNFEDLLKRKKLKPSEQMKGLSQLNEGFNSLERGYIFARDEHKLMQQSGKDVGHFDRGRELEGLIFRCEQHLEELKEQVEQMRQEQPTCEAPPSPPPQPTPPSVSSEGGEILSLPQSPTVPLLVDPGRAAEPEVSPASEESDDEEAETDDEELWDSLNLEPLTGKHRHVERDFQNSEPHYQESPVGISTQRSSRSSPSSHAASSPSTSLQVHPPSGHRGLEKGKFHSSSLSSLGETPASERRNSKLQPGSSRTLSQDGIISSETDSGFIGSESCRLSPSPLHQRASLRQRRRTYSCSPQRWVNQTEKSTDESGARLESDSSPAGGSSESNPSSSSSSSSSSCSCHCPLSRCPQPNRGTKTDSHRDSARRTSCQSAESPDRAVRRGNYAAPGARPQCMLVGLPPLMSSQPVHVLPRNKTGTSSWVRGHKEARGRLCRFVDVRDSLDRKIWTSLWTKPSEYVGT